MFSIDFPKFAKPPIETKSRFFLMLNKLTGSIPYHAYLIPRQLAIDYLALEMSKKYNKERPIVYNTYQAYLRETWRKVNHHAEWAKKANFYLGVKLVRYLFFAFGNLEPIRGAYLITETERAAKMRYRNPIWKDKDDTDANYQR